MEYDCVDSFFIWMEYDRVDNFEIKREYDREMRGYEVMRKIRTKFEGQGWI